MDSPSRTQWFAYISYQGLINLQIINVQTLEAPFISMRERAIKDEDLPSSLDMSEIVFFHLLKTSVENDGGLPTMGPIHSIKSLNWQPAGGTCCGLSHRR